MRQHVDWYLTGYAVGGEARRGLMADGRPSSRPVSTLDPTPRARTPPPVGGPAAPRPGPHPVVLPDGWLDGDATTVPDPAPSGRRGGSRG